MSAREKPESGNCPLVSNFTGDRNYAIDLSCFRFDYGTQAKGGLAAVSGDSDTAYKLATNKTSPDQRSTHRNRLEAVLVNHANQICEVEKGNLYANRAASSAILDFLSSGFSIASTIVGGEQAKSILSGAAGLSTASRTNIDSNFYQNQLVSAITQTMDAERARIADILESKRSANADEYSADDMIRIVNEYHQACSFQKGMQLLLDAAVNKEGSDRIIQSINLKSALTLIDQQMALTRDKSSYAYKALEAKRLEIVLQLAATTKNETSVTVEAPK